jgi:hypothetical protein
MTLPFPLPDWLPWWVPLVLLVPALLYMLAFLFMPFSVIGVKSRLDVLEARLDELHNELRHIALRLPDMGGTAVDYDDVYQPEPAEPARRTPVITRPPIPPASHELEGGKRGVDRVAPPPQERPARREPKLDWPH